MSNFKIPNVFMGDYKISDNVDYNLRIIELLYECYKKRNCTDKRLLYKPIIILLVSVIEAILYDFYRKAEKHTREGVPNLSDSTFKAIRKEDLKNLNNFISFAENHDLLASDRNYYEGNYYEALDKCRKLRNRIHIQNQKNNFESKERKVFSEERKVQAEKVLEYLVIVMSEKYPREKKYHKYLKGFHFPWKKHF